MALSTTNLCVTSGQFKHLRAKLCATIYRNDPAFRDNTTTLLNLVTNPRGAFALGAEMWPVTITNSAGCPLASALLIRALRNPDTLQVGFFEAAPGPAEAVKLLIREACSRAIKCSCTNILAGSNGHVNNGLGLLAGPFSHHPSFGSAYNPPHYVQMLTPLAHHIDTLVTYLHDVDSSSVKSSGRLIDRVARKFNVRHGNFHHLKSEIAIYTELNNKCFSGHQHYFERTPAEDLELFRAFGPLIREENFLVAEHNGRPAGFLLWYPDFNELVPPGSSVGLATVLRYRLLGRQPMRLKIAEVGVLPEFRNSGAILALIAHCYKLVHGRYRIAESGWIMDENHLSVALNTRWHGTPDKTYSVFHIDPKAVPA